MNRVGTVRSDGGGDRRIAVLLLQLMVTAVVVWFVLDRIGFSLEELQGTEWSEWAPSWGTFLLASLVLLGGYVLSGALWGRLTGALGAHPLSVRSAVGIHFVANLGRYIPGKIWQIAGLAVLAGKRGVNPKIAMTSAVGGQGLALLGASLIGASTLLDPTLGGTSGRWIFSGVVALVCVALIPGVTSWLANAWFRVARLDQPSETRRSSGFVARWLALYTVNWIVYVVAFWLFVVSFGLSAPLPLVGPAFAAAYVLGFVALFSPAGIGIREVTLAAFLTPAMGSTSAVTVAVLARLWMTVIELLPATWFWFEQMQGVGEAGRTVAEKERS